MCLFGTRGFGPCANTRKGESGRSAPHREPQDDQSRVRQAATARSRPLFSFLKRKTKVKGTTGVGLHPDGISVAGVEWNGEVPRLTRCRFFPTETVRQRGGVLAELTRELGLEGAHCSSVVEPGSFSLLLVEAPEVDITELRQAVRWRIKDLIDFHIDDAVIDVFDIPGQPERHRPKMMYVVVARFSAIREHIDLLEGGGLALQVIDIPELAQRNIAWMLPEDESGVALLHLGRSSGILTLTRQGDLYLSRTLDFGVDELLAESGGADGEEMSAGLQRRLDGIVLEVQRSLDYYESHFRLPPINGLVLAPTGETIPGLLGYVGGQLGIPVRTLDLNALLESAEPLSDTLQAECLLAVGAALRREEKVL